jgi:hypothetical protein
MPKRQRTDFSFPGTGKLKSYQGSCDAILPPTTSDRRQVHSKGTGFYNADRWTGRSFLKAMSDWARYNPDMEPTTDDIRGWVTYANATRVNNPHIVIAALPPVIPRPIDLALTGGVYHEAFHTRYSRRRALRLGNVIKVTSYWNRLPHGKSWASFLGALLSWSNIIEDIRIERCGCKEYPGVYRKMVELQDFILRQEGQGTTANEHRSTNNANDFLRVVTGTFRDIGLGYAKDSHLQRTALEEYQKASPEGYRFVTEGPLKPFLDRAIALGPKEDMECIWLAMEVIAEIANVAAQPEQQPQPQQGQPQEGEGQPSGSAGEDSEPQEGSFSPKKDNKPQPFKVGDLVDYKGQKCKVTRAGVPHPQTGVQDLQLEAA